MPVPIILGIAAIGAGAWALHETSDALDSATSLTKWAVIGGGVYVAFRALQAGGVLK